MKIISEANKTVLKMLGRQKSVQSEYRLNRYCVQEKADDGVLLFNLLTRELLLLTEDEFAKLKELDFLKEQWFLVPEGFDDKKCADTVRWVLESTQQRSKNMTTYTILTTTDCNARCFYCYEKGELKVKMSEETALKTAEYIKNHSGGEKVTISWFGGEPLYNLPVIDLITGELEKSGIEFSSRMISNGYLFDDETVKKATEKWKLKSVQITLDGTEKVYNKAKSYIYKNTNPYQVVLGNIECLIEAGILVVIRLNMDLYNADNLMMLAEELAERFSGKSGIKVNVRHIFDAVISRAEMHKDEEWEERYEAKCRIEDKLARYNLLQRGRISKHIKTNSCMADSDDTVVIHPSGNIGACEHYISSEFIGNINEEDIDIDIVQSWKERIPEIPECTDCFFYLDCIRLKKCRVGNVCYPQERKEFLRSTKRRMMCEYDIWRSSMGENTEKG